MRKPLPSVLVLALVAFVVALFAAETYMVKVRTTSLRKEAKFYSASLVVLKQGEPLEKVGAQGDWIQVKTAAGMVGWIHASAVEPKKFSLQALDKGLKTQATAGEVALASKGFNKEVEQNYRSKNKALNYDWVDRMGKMTVTISQVEAFLKKGKLGEFGGTK